MNKDNSYENCLVYCINHTTGHKSANLLHFSHRKKFKNFKIPTLWNKVPQPEKYTWEIHTGDCEVYRAVLTVKLLISTIINPSSGNINLKCLCDYAPKWKQTQCIFRTPGKWCALPNEWLGKGRERSQKLVQGQSSIALWKRPPGPASVQKWSRFKDTMFIWTICPILYVRLQTELWLLKHFRLTEWRKSPECFVVMSQTLLSCERQSLVRNTGISLVILGVNGTWHQLCMKGTNQKCFSYYF